MKPSLFTRVQFDRIIDALMPLIASMGALLVGAVVLMLLDVNPVEAYTAMF
ncbi:MAG: hypothetical protein H6633_08705 [Anaerolineales bacterium]|nr:hypothetical protein [Anaerolineales bacterium]